MSEYHPKKYFKYQQKKIYVDWTFIIHCSYFSSSRNGYPPGLDPRFPAFKAAATPFVGLMAPLGAPQPPTVPTTSPLSGKDPKEQNKQDALFGNPVFPSMLDMSSTQALLHMVRTANAAQNAAELETYLKGKYLQFYIKLD